MTKIEKKLNNMFLISDISRYTIYLFLFTLIIYIFTLNLSFKQDIFSFLAKVLLYLFCVNISESRGHFEEKSAIEEEEKFSLCQLRSTQLGACLGNTLSLLSFISYN